MGRLGSHTERRGRVRISGLPAVRKPPPLSDDRFSNHVLTLLAGALATVGASFGLSFLGYGGTQAGLAVGSVLTSGGTWWIERGFRRSADLAKAKAAAIKRKGQPLSVTETHYIKAVVDAKHKRDRSVPWRSIAVTASLLAAVSTVFIVFIALAAGKPVSAIVQNKPAHGLLVPVSHETSPDSGPSVKTSTPTPSSSTPTKVAQKSATPTATPTPTRSVTSVSPTPAPSPTGSSPGVASPTSTVSSAGPMGSP